MRSPFVDFSIALQNLKVGIAMQRAGWNARARVALVKPDRDSFMNTAYLYQSGAEGHKMPWTPNQTDLMAEDWYPAD
jgi:hypothetical protein